MHLVLTVPGDELVNHVLFSVVLKNSDTKLI